MSSFRHGRGDDASTEHAMGNTAFEHGLRCFYFIDMHRVEITRNTCKSIYITFTNCLAESGLIADFHFIIG